ncbi:MAG TPA: iron-containing alcohol dehydrogenase [Clostridiales bacterium]|nr:iron-containing alcohol dehydrogenase [Clostridiales bacterium]
MYKVYCRLYQKGLKIAAYFLKWREPELIQGKNSILQLSGYLKKQHISRVLLVTDHQILSIGLMDSMLRDFKEKKIHAVIYDKTVPNPTIENIEEGLCLYHREKCEAIVAFGGGSPMDPMVRQVRRKKRKASSGISGQ